MKVMEPERWARLQELFQAALPLNRPARRALLDRACADDAALRREVEALLAAEDGAADDFLQNDVAALGWQVLAEAESRRTEMLSVGMKLGARYEIVGELGSGGMGTVYQARDTQLHNRVVAVKVLSGEWWRHAWVVAKFKQEAAVLAKLDDPGIVGILDVGALPDGRPWLVMQYVDGETLEQVIRRGKLELADVAEIIKQIGRTLTTAHEAGVIHRDLKPSNLMLRRNTNGDWQAKIIDFGIAKVIGSVQEATPLPVGTPLYMSPEQHAMREVGAASDVYALGLIAYEMLTGVRPFNVNSLNKLAALQQGGVKVKPSALRPGLPKAVDDVIDEALAAAPYQRPATARAFGDALYNALTSAPAAVKIQPYLFASFLRKPWLTYSIRDGRAYTEGGLIWRRASSIPLAEASVKYKRSLLLVGRIEITGVNGDKETWSSVPNVRRVYAALERVSKGLPLKDIADDTPSHISSFITFVIWSVLTIAAWLSSLPVLLTIPWETNDAQTAVNQAVPMLGISLVLATVGGVLAAIWDLLAEVVRAGKNWLKPEPRPFEFDALFGFYFIAAIVGGALWEGLAKITFPSWPAIVLAAGLIAIGLSVGVLIATVFVVGFLLELIRREVRNALYNGQVAIFWWCVFWLPYAWVFGILIPPLGWLGGAIVIFPYVLDKRFVWRVSEADATKLAKWDSWRRKVLPAALLLTLLTMLLRYASSPSLFAETSLLVIGTATTICSFMGMFALLAYFEKRGSFNRLRKWQK